MAAMELSPVLDVISIRSEFPNSYNAPDKVLSAIQIISHKAEIMSLKSAKRKLQVELDTLRNQAISDDIEIKDTSENIEL